MKKKFYLCLPAIALATAGAFCLLFITGCQEPVKKTAKVNINDGNEFPAFLAGTWNCDTDDWELVIDPNGRITKARVSIGRVEMVPDKITRVPMKESGEGVFEPGEWIVKYDPNTSEMLVQIGIKHFKARKGDDIIEGSSKDTFIGPVDPNGMLWEADWISIPEYFVSTDKYKNYSLPIDENEFFRGKVMFKKVNKQK